MDLAKKLEMHELIQNPNYELLLMHFLSFGRAQAFQIFKILILMSESVQNPNNAL